MSPFMSLAVFWTILWMQIQLDTYLSPVAAELFTIFSFFVNVQEIITLISLALHAFDNWDNDLFPYTNPLE